jgi:hypothetical protein
MRFTRKIVKCEKTEIFLGYSLESRRRGGKQVLQFGGLAVRLRTSPSKAPVCTELQNATGLIIESLKYRTAVTRRRLTPDKVVCPESI